MAMYAISGVYNAKSAIVAQGGQESVQYWRVSGNDVIDTYCATKVVFGNANHGTMMSTNGRTCMHEQDI